MRIRYVVSCVMLLIAIEARSAEEKKEKKMDPVSKALFGMFGSSEFKPEKFKEVPFDMAINPNFKEQLRYKKFWFSAVYYGLEPNLGKYEQVEQHFNIKLCDTPSRETCTHKTVVHQLQREEIFKLKKGTRVRVYGSILEVAGVSLGGGDRLMNRDLPNGGFSDLFLVKVAKVIPATS
jgi:hypothetical protein